MADSRHPTDTISASSANAFTVPQEGDPLPSEVWVVCGQHIKGKWSSDFVCDYRQGAMEHAAELAGMEEAQEFGPYRVARYLAEPIHAVVAEGLSVASHERITDAMVDVAIAFGEKATYFGHPNVREWRGTDSGDTEESWTRDYTKALLEAVLSVAPTERINEAPQASGAGEVQPCASTEPFAIHGKGPAVASPSTQGTSAEAIEAARALKRLGDMIYKSGAPFNAHGAAVVLVANELLRLSDVSATALKGDKNG